MQKALPFRIAGFALASRATDYQPVYSRDEILIVNNSKEPIRDLSISVAGGGARLWLCQRRAARNLREQVSPSRL